MSWNLGSVDDILKLRSYMGKGKCRRWEGRIWLHLCNLQWRWLFVIQWWNGACNCTSMVHKNLMVPSLFLTLFPFIPLTGPNFQWAFWWKFSQKLKNVGHKLYWPLSNLKRVVEYLTAACKNLLVSGFFEHLAY
jgi:hypothetical protein